LRSGQSTRGSGSASATPWPPPTARATTARTPTWPHTSNTTAPWQSSTTTRPSAPLARSRSSRPCLGSPRCSGRAVVYRGAAHPPPPRHTQRAHAAALQRCRGPQRAGQPAVRLRGEHPRPFRLRHRQPLRRVRAGFAAGRPADQAHNATTSTFTSQADSQGRLHGPRPQQRRLHDHARAQGYSDLASHLQARCQQQASPAQLAASLPTPHPSPAACWTPQASPRHPAR